LIGSPANQESGGGIDCVRDTAFTSEKSMNFSSPMRSWLKPRIASKKMNGSVNRHSVTSSRRSARRSHRHPSRRPANRPAAIAQTATMTRNGPGANTGSRWAATHTT
jgi:hypothetical protein